MTEITKEAVARIAARRVAEARKCVSGIRNYSESDKQKAAAETALEVAAEMLDLIIGAPTPGDISASKILGKILSDEIRSPSVLVRMEDE